MTISPFRTRAALLGLLVTIAACATSSVASGASDENTINFGGYERHYVVHKPAGIGDRAVPLVVALHGGVGTGKIMEDQTGLDAVADQHDFIVVYPDGVGRAWNAGSRSEEHTSELQSLMRRSYAVFC